MKLAIIDIDGVVADASVRFKRAEEIKQGYLYPESRDAVDVYWRAALDPEMVYTDTVIDGANDRLNWLIGDGYTIVFLTSRPHVMAEATAEWFSLHVFLKASTEIIFKSPGFQYVKTPVWKVGMFQTLIDWYRPDYHVIIVDDERAHWLQAENVKCYPSLAAIFAPPTPVDDSDPFLPDE